MHELRLDVLNQRASLSTDDPEIGSVLRDVFGAFAAVYAGHADLSLGVLRRGPHFEVRTSSGAPVACSTLSDVVHVVDKDLTVEVQRRRPDLLFVHAAVLQYGSQAIVLAGDSGSGKSTTSWGLASLGFGFMSDELAPIDPQSLRVDPYPRALGLKRVPEGLELPATALRLERTIHVPAADLGMQGRAAPLPLSRIFFVHHDPAVREPRIDPITTADTAARLYVLCLNALAHPASGLDAVASIATGVRGYSLTTAGLADTCERLRTAVEAA